MNEAAPADCGPDRVEISNGIQTKPSRHTGQFGTRLEYENVGRMVFCAEAVTKDGGHDVLYCGPSYERAIIEAEECAKDQSLTVHDLVAPGSA